MTVAQEQPGEYLGNNASSHRTELRCRNLLCAAAARNRHRCLVMVSLSQDIDPKRAVPCKRIGQLFPPGRISDSIHHSVKYRLWLFIRIRTVHEFSNEDVVIA